MSRVDFYFFNLSLRPEGGLGVLCWVLLQLYLYYLIANCIIIYWIDFTIKDCFVSYVMEKTGLGVISGC